MPAYEANFGSFGTDVLPGDVVNGAKPEPKLFPVFALYWQCSQVYLLGQHHYPKLEPHVPHSESAIAS